MSPQVSVDLLYIGTMLRVRQWSSYSLGLVYNVIQNYRDFGSVS